jgi:dimethylamine monooxygenase subunit C
VNPSRPVHAGLDPDPCAQAHLIVADAEAAVAVLDLFAKGGAAFATRATVLSLPGPDLDRLNAKLLCLFPDIPTLLRNFEECMEAATMGTSIYITGSESFIGEAAKRAANYGIAFASLRTELRGSIARRVQCVHCKSTAEQVVTPTVTCPHCQRRLMVRDHYSHRLNAYMGVSIDAEEPAT